MAIYSVGLTLGFSHVSFGIHTFSAFVWSSLTAPYEAHILTVLYSRFADPKAPVIHPDVRSWCSVWEGH